jgi:thiamine pyrophosphate-dependent acetolactate synthase large subunit-like protein
MNDDDEGRIEATLAERLAQLSPVKRELLLKKQAARRINAYDLVARSLRECGVTHIYAVAGLPTEAVIPACSNQNIRPIGVRHQASAVCMAVAHNYQAGKLCAVALVSAGPAVSNAITGLLVAHDNGWPVVVLGGQRSSFQKFDPMPIVRPVTKHAVSVPSTTALRQSIHESCHIAMSGRPGPVYVDLHEDVLAGQAHAEPGADCDHVATTGPPQISPAEVEKAADALLSAGRPAMLLGEGVRWTLLPSQLRKLVETLSLPVITSPMGRGFIADDHPLCFNQARAVLQSKADVVLVLGARLNWIFRHGVELSPKAKIFRIDIEQDDQESSAGVDFIQADAGEFVDRLLELLTSEQTQISAPLRLQHLKDWHDILHLATSATRRLLEDKTSNSGRPMSVYRMMKEVRDALPEDVICITEGNISMRAAQAVIPAGQPASRMDAGVNACMGVGVPFAIGAKVACPDRPVVVIAGDYGFSLSAMEIEVCVRQAIPIVVIVANNQGNCGATKQRAFFGEENSELVTMFQPGIEYDQLLTMFGGRGTSVDNPDTLSAAVTEALSCGGPYCINVIIDPETPLPNAWGEQGIEIDPDQ